MDYKLKAVYLAKEIPISNVKQIAGFRKISSTRETASFKQGNITLFVYSFGSAVLCNCPTSEERAVLKKLRQCGKDVKEHPKTDSYRITTDPKVPSLFSIRASCITIDRVDQTVLATVARVLAQSVALEYYEEEYSAIETRFNDLNSHLSKTGRLGISRKEALKTIASNNVVIGEIVTGIGILDKPESAWGSTFINNLHTKLADEFELAERFENINNKVNFIKDNYVVFLESISGEYDAKLEWIIIVLILIEILMFIGELLFM